MYLHVSKSHFKRNVVGWFVKVITPLCIFQNVDCFIRACALDVNVEFRDNNIGKVARRVCHFHGFKFGSLSS